MRYCLLLSLISAVSATAAFEPLILTYDGQQYEPNSVLRADPVTVTVDAGIFPWPIIQGSNGVYETVYDPATGLPGTNFELTSFSSSPGDGLALGGQSTFITLWDRASNFTNPTDGIITIYRNGALEEFAPSARTALGGGSGDFHYRYPVASVSGDTVAMLGIDAAFPHFVLRATDGNIDILAQESVDVFPGSTQMFSDFASSMAVSPDGSKVAFYGRSNGIQDLQGLFVSDGTAIAKVFDLDTVIPGTTDTIGDIFPGGLFPNGHFGLSTFFGYDGELYVFLNTPDILLKYAGGTLENILESGDSIAGTAITTLSVGSNALAANGDLLINDFLNDRFIHYDGFDFTVYREPREIVSGESFSFPQFASDYAYMPSRLSDNGEFTTTLYRLPLSDGSATEALHVFDTTNFVNMQAISPNTVIVSISEVGYFIGGPDDFELPNGVSDPAFDAFVSSLAADQQGIDDDPDGDGRENLVEFAEGTNPGMADTVDSMQAVYGLQTGTALGLTGDTDQYVTLTLRIHQDAANITVSPVSAQTLALLTTSPDALIEISESVVEGNFLVHTYRSATALNASGRLFLRVIYSLGGT